MATNLATGFASLNGGTSGGLGGAAVAVSTGRALQDAIDTALGPLTIFVTGTITPENSGPGLNGLGEINISGKRDLTLIGAGAGAEFDRIGIRISDGASNLILQNLEFHHVRAGVGDAISIEGPSRNIWIDHNELYSTLDVPVDEYDGLLDIKDGAEYVTVSNNHFRDHHKVMLVGFNDLDAGSRFLTVSHNLFENLGSRVPSLRFGEAHIYENLFRNIGESAINLRMGAVALIENNVFENVRNPVASFDSATPGLWNLRGNLMTGVTWSQPGSTGENATGITAEDGQSTTDYVPSYAYTLVGTENVAAHVLANGGSGRLDPAPQPPPPVEIGRLFMGGALADSLAGGAGNDLLDGLGAADTLRGGDGQDSILGGTGDDRLFGGTGGDTLRGGSGRDSLVGEAGDDMLDGGESRDTLLGGDGNDSLLGGLEDDRLVGGEGNDSLLGGDGKDSMAGEAGSDGLDGGLGADTLDGGDGKDRLFGGGGNDRLAGGADADVLEGDDGVDMASYRGSDGGVAVDLAAGMGAGGHAQGDSLAAVENLQGSAWADLLRGDGQANRLEGWDGADRLEGGGGNDRLFGEAGDDTLLGGLGVDTLTGGAGADSFAVLSAAESPRRQADTVADFSQAEGDRLDLSAIGGLRFVGDAAFKKVAGELRSRFSSGQTWLEADLNGDGVADFSVRLNGLHAVQAADLVL